MFADERRKTILELVRNNGAVAIKELARTVQTSEVTVRRDLRLWEARACSTAVMGAPSRQAGSAVRPATHRSHTSRARRRPPSGKRFEPKSYGLRPGCGCHDAIGAIYPTLNGKNPQRVWVLDADLTAAFDRIDDDRLMAALGTFPPGVWSGNGSRPGPGPWIEARSPAWPSPWP